MLTLLCPNTENYLLLILNIVLSRHSDKNLGAISYTLSQYKWTNYVKDSSLKVTLERGSIKQFRNLSESLMVWQIQGYIFEHL